MSGFEYKKSNERNRKPFKKHGSNDRHDDESDVPTMIKKMQQQLVFLERKIDLLLGQSPNKPRTEGYVGSFPSKRDNSFGERSSYKDKNAFSPRSSGRKNKLGEKNFFKGKKSVSPKKRGRA